MATIKKMSRLGKILLGLFGIASLFSSCAKEKDCTCTYTYGNYSSTAVVTTKSDCGDLKFTYNGEELTNFTCQ